MDSDSIAENLAFDYSEYLSFDLPQQREQVLKSISSLEKKLEEFSSLLESVNVDTSLSVDSLLPEVVQMYGALKTTFRQIDKLEDLVSVVDKCVTDMEGSVDKAESLLSTDNSIISVLKPLLRKTKPKSPTPANFERPVVFSTEKLLADLAEK